MNSIYRILEEVGENWVEYLSVGVALGSFLKMFLHLV